MDVIMALGCDSEGYTWETWGRKGRLAGFAAVSSNTKWLLRKHLWVLIESK